MNENIKALYEKVSANDELKEVFKKGVEAARTEEERQEYIIGFAKDQGFDITPEDFPKAAENELADDELENVAGGITDDKIIRCALTLGLAFIDEC